MSFGPNKEGLYMTINTPEYRAIVVKHHPEGDHCNRCGKKNDNWDDCGWWYSMVPGASNYIFYVSSTENTGEYKNRDYVPLCNACESELGIIHNGDR